MDQQKIHIETHVYLTQEQHDYLVAEAKRINERLERRGINTTIEPESLISGIVSRAIDSQLMQR